MPEKPRLERQAMCDRLAMEFQDGWIVNLGVGMPTLCSNYVDPTKDLVYHSENGVIGYGPLAAPGAVDRHLVNAGMTTSSSARRMNAWANGSISQWPKSTISRAPARGSRGCDGDGGLRSGGKRRLC